MSECNVKVCATVYAKENLHFAINYAKDVFCVLNAKKLFVNKLFWKNKLNLFHGMIRL